MDELERVCPEEATVMFWGNMKWVGNGWHYNSTFH